MWRLQKQPFSLILSLGLVYGVLGLVFGGVQLVGPFSVRIGSQGWVGALLGCGLLYCYGWYRARSDGRYAVPGFQWILLLFALLLVLSSDVVGRPFGFYTGAQSRILIWVLGVGAALLLLWRARIQQCEGAFERFFSWPQLLFWQSLIVLLFLQHTAGRMIFSDDHPAFLYRFYLLQEQFPNIPFYSPAWEAGYSAREFFASGIMNVFFLAFPLWYSGIDFSTFQSLKFYNYLIPYIYVGIVPLACYLAARLFRLRHPVAILVALFSLGPTLGYFEWLLKYGTLGFCCSMGLLPLGIALCWRLAIDDRQPGLRHVIALLLVSYLCISWTLAAFAFLPAACFALFRFHRTFSTPRRWYVIAFALVFVAANGPWIATFFQESKVISFFGKSAMPGAEVVQANSSDQREKEIATNTHSRGARETAVSRLRLVREMLAKVNPLLLLFCVPGLLLINDSGIRRTIYLTLGFLVLLAVGGDYLKPQLELRRMIIPATFLACIPAAQAVYSMLQSFYCAVVDTQRAKLSMHSVLQFLALAFGLGAVLVSPLTVAAVYQGRSDESFVLEPQELQPLSNAIREHGGSGRTFFLGFILQELGATHYALQDGGHIAPLSAFTGKPLYAFYYYHSRWMTIDPVPESYRARGQAGIEEFLDLLNVTAVVAFKPEWVRYCRESASYREVFRQGRFFLFTRKGPASGYLQKGQAEVGQRLNGLLVTPRSSEVVLKFRYLPKLRSIPADGVSLFPVDAFIEESGVGVRQQVQFIGLRVSPELLGRAISIGYRPDALSDVVLE